MGKAVDRHRPPGALVVASVSPVHMALWGRAEKHCCKTPQGTTGMWTLRLRGPAPATSGGNGNAMLGMPVGT